MRMIAERFSSDMCEECRWELPVRVKVVLAAGHQIESERYRSGPSAVTDVMQVRGTQVAADPITAAISVAISSTVCVAVLRASLSARDGLYPITSCFVILCQIGSSI